MKTSTCSVVVGVLIGVCPLISSAAAPFIQQARLKASNAGSSDSFGEVVAISGNTAVVGAQYEDSNATGVNGNGANNSLDASGAAYVFVRQGKTWTQQAYLKASNTAYADKFGGAVAISGDTIVVGAPNQDSNATNSGAVYVFVRTGSTWSQQAFLKASNAGSDDYFGYSVAIDGDTLVVGSLSEASNATGIDGDGSNNTMPGAGAVYVFTRSGTAWTQQAYIKASNTEGGDQFGRAVAISGDTLVAGALGESSSSGGVGGNQADNSATSAGAAYVFSRDGTGVWSQQAYLKASHPETYDYFSASVSASGDRIVVGATYEASSSASDPTDNSATSAGAAYVFVRSGNTWSQEAYLKASNIGEYQYFGSAVSIDDSLIAVGAYGDDGASGVAYDAGAVHVFAHDGTAWTHQALLRTAVPHTGDYFGQSVSIDNASIIGGASYEDGMSGAAYVFVENVPDFLTSVARRGQAAPGGSNIFYSAFSAATLNNDMEVLFDATLTGSGTSGGRTRALFSTYSGDTAMAMRVQENLSALGAGWSGVKASAFSAPVANHPDVGLFQATLVGTGVTTGNNKALLRDTGSAVSSVQRTGQALGAFGGAAFSTLKETLQATDRDLAAQSYLLKPNTSLGVTAANDSGLLLMKNDGTVILAAQREGNVTVGGSLRFGQFFGRAALSGGPTSHFGAYFVFLDGTAGGAPVQGLFQTKDDGTVECTLAQGQAPVGTWGALWQAFLGESASGDHPLFRASMSGMGVTSATNEGIWRGASELWLRKGQSLEQPLAAGIKLAKILKFWPVMDDQMVVLVQLTGTGVTTATNTALLLRQADGTLRTLLRSGTAVAGLAAPARCGIIQQVDVNPASGHYAVLASLLGASTSTNQVLWTGCTRFGDDGANWISRLPLLTLRKGATFQTAATPANRTIRSITLNPVVNTTGAGGRGAGQVVNNIGQVLIQITSESASPDLIIVTPQIPG